MFKIRLQRDQQESLNEFPTPFLPRPSITRIEPWPCEPWKKEQAQYPFCSIPKCQRQAQKCCVQCKLAYYCCSQCQRKDWKLHRHRCALPKNTALYVSAPISSYSLDFLIYYKAMVFTSVLNLIYDTQLHPDRVYIQWAADAEPRPFLASLLSAWWQVEFQVKPSIISELIGRGARCTGKQPWSTFPSINILQWLYRCGLKIPVLSNIPESHYTNETRNVIAWLMEHGATYECVPYNLLHQMYKDDPRFEHPATKIILRSYMMTGGWIGQLMDVREHHLGVYSIYALMTANNHTEALNWIQERRINLVSILAEVVIEVPLPLYLIITDFYFDPCNFIWCKGFKELCVSQRAILEFELQKFRQTNLQGKLFDPDPKSGIDS